MYLKDQTLYASSLELLPDKKLLISTINAHSHNLAQKDPLFAEALQNSDVLLPDGIGIVGAVRLLMGVRLQKIAGADLFCYEMNRLNRTGGRCFFLGSSESTLRKIREKAAKEYPNIQLHTYSPPYKPEFSEEDNKVMIAAVNEMEPNVLFIGMTAPKQEKWAYQAINNSQLIINNCHVCCIGAVFDFYAGTVTRAPRWMIKLGLEWFYRLVKEPRRMWRRYLIGNTKFIYYVMKEKWQRSGVPGKNRHSYT